jgi:phosphatidylglycerol---prolipoprotein diacylglyceryl transferase
MINLLHSHLPGPVLIALGPLDVHWYGLFIVIGVLAALLVIMRLAGYYGVSKSSIIDLSFYLIIGGVIGARLYHVVLEWPYYWRYPAEIFQIWHGGLAIHGAIIAGGLICFVWARKSGVNPWLLLSVCVAGMPLAQAIGRWGNYFNQELFGLPTDLPWGIPIAAGNRPAEYFNYQYFHPAFLYECLGDLAVFFILLLFHFWIIKGRRFSVRYYQLALAGYLMLYSALRFFTEFIRVDEARVVFGLRFPQAVSITIILATIAAYCLLARGRSASAVKPLK